MILQKSGMSEPTIQQPNSCSAFTKTLTKAAPPRSSFSVQCTSYRMKKEMTQEYEIRLEVILNGEAARKLLLEADRRGLKPELLASQLLEFIAMDDMFRAVLDG
jgi:hypothetical protein